MFTWLSYVLGWALLKVGKLEGAVKYLSAAVERNPDYSAARLLLAWAFERLGRYEEALLHSQALVAREPEWVDGHLGVGCALQGLNRHVEAIAAFKKATECEDRKSLAYQYLAHAYAACGNLAAALLAHRQLVQLEPNSAEANRNIADMLEQIGQREEAISFYQRAMTLRPSVISADNLAGALIRLGRFAEARGFLQHGLAIEPNSAELKIKMALVLAELGRAPDATALLRDVAKDPQAGGRALAILSHHLRGAGDIEGAYLAALQAVEHSANLPDARMALGWVFLDQGQFEQALENFEKAKTLSPTDLDVIASHGAALSSLGRHRLALAIFNDVLARDPDYFQRAPELAEYLSRSRARESSSQS